jgi:peptide/nickel transport system permease protein
MSTDESPSDMPRMVEAVSELGAAVGPALSVGAGPRQWRVLLRFPSTIVATLFAAVAVLSAIFAPVFLTGKANDQDLSLRLLHPFHFDHGWLYVLGADPLGRSILARILVGAQATLFVAGAAVLAAFLVGLIVGAVSGFFGGWVDALIMRLTDIVLTFPGLLLALAVLYVLGGGMLALIGVLAFTRLPVYIRSARIQTIELKERTFVEAARALGASRSNLILRQITPMLVPTLVTVTMVDIARAMLSAAGLSFLGVGLQSPIISWGEMITSGRSYLTTGWWVTVFPGVVMTLTALSINIMSNYLRAASDPLQADAVAKRGRRKRRAAREERRR